MNNIIEKLSQIDENNASMEADFKNKKADMTKAQSDRIKQYQLEASKDLEAKIKEYKEELKNNTNDILASLRVETEDDIAKITADFNDRKEAMLDAMFKDIVGK